MAEWFKAAVLKTVEGRKVLREFESLSLRQKKALSFQHTAVSLRTCSILVSWFKLRADC
jgi:hypothetical protein